MRVCVAAICRNEEKNMQEFLEHVKHADSICIVDTGSEDSTVRIIENFEHPDLHFFFDIDPTGARNLGESRNLSATPFGDDDLIVWLDIDERFSDPNWVAELKELPAVPDRVNILMVNGTSEYNQIKAYRKGSFVWKYRAHEVLNETMERPYTSTSVSFHTDHYPDLEKPRNYLAELAGDVAQYPHEDRPSFYYGRELCYRVIDGDKTCYREAIQEVSRLKKICNWIDYVALANIELSCAAYLMDDKPTTIRAMFEAMAARPDRIEVYGTAADIYFRWGDSVFALGLALQGINAKDQTPFLFNSSQTNLELCLEIAYKSCKDLGMIEKACHYYALLSSNKGLDVSESLKTSGLLELLQPS